MKGFSKTGIMLLPKLETYRSRDDFYHLNLKKSIAKALAFFKSKDIQLECFTTDELANQLRPEGVEWVNASTPEDIFFIKKNVEGMTHLMSGKDIDYIYEEVRTKYPAGRGLSLEDRFDILLKRDKWSANKYIQEQKLVITFEHSQNAYYKIKTKDGDGRIIFRVNHNNFTISSILSGQPIDVTYLAEYNGATKPLYAWEV